MKSSYLEKPLPHYTPRDWVSNNRNTEKITLLKGNIANNVRQESRQLRDGANNTMDWKLKETNLRMADRINDIDQWYRNLERSLDDVKTQIARLSEAKLAMEKTQADNMLLHEVTKEILALRDRRRNIDLVEDEPYCTIKKELTLLDTIKNRMAEASHEVWLQLVALKNQRDKLVADLKDKDEALRIDKYKLSLTPNSVGEISYKPWPLDIPERTVDIATWMRNCVHRKKEAEDCLVRAMQKTNDTWALLRSTANDIQKQREATQFALRRRMHDTLQARDILAAQRKDLMDEIDRLEREMKAIEDAIRTFAGNLKLVHTRLENRKWRPRIELCHDLPQEGLRQEVGTIVATKEYLNQQLRDLKNVLNGVRQHLHRVEDDLERKEHSLAIENSCIQIHERPARAPYQMDISWMDPSSNLYTSTAIDRGRYERELDHYCKRLQIRDDGYQNARHDHHGDCGCYPHNSDCYQPNENCCFEGARNATTMTDPNMANEYLLID